MPSPHEEFWQAERFAVIGHSTVKPFPMLTYDALKRIHRKTVFAVDESCSKIDGDPAYKDLDSLPEKVDAAVLEVPREETAVWVSKLAAAGITKVWIHMGRETPEALQVAEDKGVELCTGTCAVQYLSSAFPHNIHRFLRKLTGRW